MITALIMVGNKSWRFPLKNSPPLSLSSLIVGEEPSSSSPLFKSSSIMVDSRVTIVIGSFKWVKVKGFSITRKPFFPSLVLYEIRRHHRWYRLLANSLQPLRKPRSHFILLHRAWPIAIANTSSSRDDKLLLWTLGMADVSTTCVWWFPLEVIMGSTGLCLKKFAH